MIKLTRTTSYKDGGTEAFMLIDYVNKFPYKSGVVFCRDNRIKSTTKGCWYEGYPEKSNGNLVDTKSEFSQALDAAYAALKK